MHERLLVTVQMPRLARVDDVLLASRAQLLHAQPGVVHVVVIDRLHLHGGEQCAVLVVHVEDPAARYQKGCSMAADGSAMNRAHVSLDSSSGSSGVLFCCLRELLALDARLEERIGGSRRRSRGRDEEDYAVQFLGGE